MTNSITYKCTLHYKDGLNKNLKLSQEEFDETKNVWIDEMDNTYGDKLVYLKIRITEEVAK